jgi:hypothetical protein
MRTMIARPVLLVTTSSTEPEPQHDRPTGTPTTQPSRPRLLRASTPAEIQREDDRAGDDSLGYERDETDNLLVRAEGEDDRPPLPQREPGKTLTEDCLNGWRLAA